jgi:hypothetical protein
MGRLKLFLAAFWWGSLSAVGFMVVPLLFSNMATPAEAGRMAAVLFSAQTWVCIVCGLGLIVAARRQLQDDTLFSRESVKAQPSGWVITGMLLALLLEFVVAPRILERDDLAFWHSVGSALYFAQWLCATGFMWRMYSKINRAR